MRLSFASAKDLRDAMASRTPLQLIDVRERSEFATESIEGSVSVPLSKLDSEVSTIDRTCPVYVLCRSGVRSKKAGEKLIQDGFSTVYCIEGGLNAWKALRYPVLVGPSKIWAMERQVRFGAGTLVLLGLGLGWRVHPAFYALAAFVAAGLIFSAVTNTCGMARVLMFFPWNH